MNGICPACDGKLEVWGTAPDKLTGSGEFPLSRCLGCRSLVLQPMPSEGDLAAFYPPDYWYRERDDSVLSRLEWRYRRWVLSDHVRFVTRFLRQPAKVLDVGCGAGTFLFLLKERGYQVQGLDLSPAAALEAEARYSVPVRVGSLRDQWQSLRQWSPEAVTMFHVLEHLTDPAAALRQVGCTLQPGGQLFLQVPSIDSWQARLFQARWYGLDAPRHAVNYTAAGLRQVVARAGFEITHSKRFSLRDNSPSWVSSLLPGVDPLKCRLAGEEERMLNLVYALLVAALEPLAALEAACGAGGTLFVRAVKIAEA
ncbi:MAG: class I SAM-dependent methyltransferase [Acidobacteria bacterium]|nr:class I SAM-dependent methyltransferase [Acidobacteriota bacterium]